MKNQFIERPASKFSLSKRKLVCGVGLNDANYEVCPRIDGEVIVCLFYRKWKDMITRCYSSKLKNRNPTYNGCAVVKEWLTFSVFKSWMINQDWQNKHLDKDIIQPGNKVYSPSNCRFITPELNNIMTDSVSRRGKYPRGVSLNKLTGKYYAQIRTNGSSKGLGFFDTPGQASEAYIKAKTKLILEAATSQNDPLIASGLRQHAELLSK